MTPSQDSAGLPDPAVLEKYHAIDPELARRVLEQAIEAEGRAAEAARRDLRARHVRSDLLAAAPAFAGGWLAWLLLAWHQRDAPR